MKNFFNITLAVSARKAFVSAVPNRHPKVTMKRSALVRGVYEGYRSQSADIEKMRRVYIEWLERAPAGAESSRVRELDQDQLPQYDLVEGYTFVTRYEEDARHLGTFQYYTHYMPQQLPFNDSNGLTPAECWRWRR